MFKNALKIMFSFKNVLRDFKKLYKALCKALNYVRALRLSRNDFSTFKIVETISRYLKSVLKLTKSFAELICF